MNELEKKAEEFLENLVIQPDCEVYDKEDEIWHLNDLLAAFAEHHCKERVNHALEANALLVDEIEKLRRFAVHDDKCKSLFYSSTGTAPCSCGLTKIINRLPND